MRFICLIAMVLLPEFATAQCKYDYNWVFGYNTKNQIGTQINFQSGELVYPKLIKNIESYSSSFSNTNGELILYSNGCHVFNSDHQIIDNKLINENSYYTVEDCHSFGNTGHSGWNHDILFVPVGHNDSSFLLIYKPRSGNDWTGKIWVDRINTAKLSIGQDGQYHFDYLDSVIYKKMNKGAAFNLVKKKNSNNWFLTNEMDSTNRISIFEIIKDSIIFRKEQKFPEINPAKSNSVCSKFSPDGKLYARYDTPLDSANNWIRLFDFDRENGTFTYKQQFKVNNDALSLCGGLEFSGSGKFLYVTHCSQVYQYDMTQTDIPSSIELVATYDGFQLLGFPSNFFYPQRGPDCRIYINVYGSMKFLHYIDQPEVKGIGCNVMQHALETKEWYYVTQAFYPNYRLDSGCATCDSTLAIPLSVATQSVPTSKGYIRISPNPIFEAMHIQIMAGASSGHGDVAIYDMNGKMQKGYDVNPNDEEIQVDCSKWPSGMYLVVYRYRGRILQSEQVVVR